MKGRSCAAAGLRKRRGPGATRPSEQPRQPGGQEKENVNPAHDSSPQPWRSRDAGTDAAVVAMWERSVRDIFAALADEEGSSTFGFRVTAEKNPKDGDLPAIVLPSKQSAPATRRTEPRPIFMAAGSAKPPEPEFLLSAVNGQPVSGMTAQEIKDLVNRRRLLLKLDLVSGKDKRKERRLVWCRQVCADAAGARTSVGWARSARGEGWAGAPGRARTRRQTVTSTSSIAPRPRARGGSEDDSRDFHPAINPSALGDAQGFLSAL